MSESESEFMMDVDREEGEPLGVLVDTDLRIVEIVPGGLADGHLAVGDVIRSVNEKLVRNKQQFFQRLRFAHPRLRVLVRRLNRLQCSHYQAASEDQATAVNDGISAELDMLIERRPGFEYLNVEFDWGQRKDRSLGIVLANRRQRVIVTGLKPGSLGEEVLEVLDRCIAINGVLVSDKEVAKHIIIQSGGRFNMIVERPLTPNAKREFMDSKIPKSSPTITNFVDPSADEQTDDFYEFARGDTSILPADVLEIARDQIMEMREGNVVPGVGILRAPTEMRPRSRLLIQNQSRETFIGSDIRPNKRIRHVPKADPANILPQEDSPTLS